MWFVEGPGGQPRNDDEYFERMTRVVFQAGMNWQTVTDKWSTFREAFDHFSIGKVADFSEEDIVRLLRNTGIIRNRRKILATIANARQLRDVVREFGAVRAYIEAITQSGNDKAARKELVRRFHHLGPVSADIFLLSVGVTIAGAGSAPWIIATRHSNAEDDLR